MFQFYARNGTRKVLICVIPSGIDSVLTGTRGGTQLRSLLADLDSKQEVMLMGHTVPMEVVLRVRTFDANVYGVFQEPL
jgi:uncharacterized protein